MFMDVTKKIAALFDCDGVIIDTERQYTVFWNEQGRKYLGEENFGMRIKGQTLVQIYDKYFTGKDEVRSEITAALNHFEKEMSYDYIPGVKEFIADLHKNGVKIALVTSSNREKMKHVYHAHPEFPTLFDELLTAERFTRSKPDPECFLLGMKLFDTDPRNTFVFEDSFHGLQAGRSSGATVIGLATTNPREAIAEKSDYVIDNFTGMNFQHLLSFGMDY